MRVEDSPPPLVQGLLDRVDRADFRAYPMLSRRGWWSLRLKGLEVARVGARKGAVDVGKDRDKQPGPERTTWLATVLEGRVVVTDDDSVMRAAAAVGRFADAWAAVAGADSRSQNEHALESRVLRGAVPLRPSSGPELELLTPPGDTRVSWGSQFPTRWGPTRIEQWSVPGRTAPPGERSVGTGNQGGRGGGVGRYYRHAVAQAVLYRHFIRQAEHLDPWFRGSGWTAGPVGLRSSSRSSGARRLVGGSPQGGVRSFRRRADHGPGAVRHGGTASVRTPAGPPVVVSTIADLLAATGCPDVDALTDLVDGDCEPDMWVAELEDGAGVEMGAGRGPCASPFPSASTSSGRPRGRWRPRRLPGSSLRQSQGTTSQRTPAPPKGWAETTASSVWARTAREKLVETAKTCTVIAGPELSRYVQDASGVRTTQLIRYWIGEVLFRVAKDCGRREKPMLSALCVTQGGASAAVTSARCASSMEPNQRTPTTTPPNSGFSATATSARASCRWCGPAVTPQVQARRARRRSRGQPARPWRAVPYLPHRDAAGRKLRLLPVAVCVDAMRQQRRYAGVAFSEVVMLAWRPRRCHRWTQRSRPSPPTLASPGGGARRGDRSVPWGGPQGRTVLWASTCSTRRPSSRCPGRGGTPLRTPASSRSPSSTRPSGSSSPPSGVRRSRRGRTRTPRRADRSGSSARTACRDHRHSGVRPACEHRPVADPPAC